MKTIKRRFRKGTALLLACTMMAGLVTAMPGNIVNVKAATVDPSVTAYATKDQLNGNTFTPGGDGKSNTIGKLVFGKNSSGNPQEWYILGNDSGVSGDNTILFAASSITAKSKFAPYSYADPDEISISEITGERATLKGTYIYTDGKDSSSYDTVYCNHYGISTLRAELRDLAQNTNYFTVTEQNMMNTTLVKTPDTRNGLEYTTEDKLYALKSTNYGRIYAGSGDNIAISPKTYYGYWNDYEQDYAFWLRTPQERFNKYSFYAYASGTCGSYYVNREKYVHPATNLKLTNVLFASAAKAPSSGTVEAGSIAEGTAMTLRLNGSGKTIGIVEYDATNDEITAQNDVNAVGPVSLVIQGKNGETDWFYSVKLGSKTVVTKAQIEEACGISGISLANCKIWLETSIDNVTYAKEATQTNGSNGSSTNYINSVAVTGLDAPVENADFDTVISCDDSKIAKMSITFFTTGENGEEEVSGKADWNKSYKAKITLGPGAVGDTFYAFSNSVSVTLNGKSMGNIPVNPDGTLTITTQEFTKTAKRKILSVTAPTVPSTFTNYYGHEGYDPILTSSGNGELGTQAEVTFETDVPPTTKAMDVTWTIESAGGVYDNTPGASNTFRWTITDASAADYNITTCPGYDSSKAALTGTVTIANKAATPVTITGTDSSIEYTGEVIDVAQYFNIDANAGSATYSDVTGSGDGKGVGTLVGSQLTVTQTGEFQIKVNTAANGIYAAGEKTITLTVGNGNIQYTMSDYSGIYDGQPHSISLTGLVPDDATVTYSTDGTTFDAANPSFTNVGTYTVYYSISKDNYNTSNGSKTVTINKKSVTIKADEQNIIWGNVIDQSSYLADGLVTGDSIADVTLSPSTSALTDNGTISVSDVKIVNAAGEDVTGNYDITTQNGTLKIAHDTTLPLDRIEAVKTKTSYTAGDTLNVDDITVTAYYSDGYSVAVTGFTTNVDAISMSEIGDKTLTVSYTEKGITKTANIDITVLEKKSDSYQIIDGANSSYIAGNGKELSIRGNGDFAKFVGITVDGMLVDAKNYTV